MPALLPKQIKLHLKTVPKWSKRGQTLTRTFKFKAFLDGIRFVRQIATKSEKAQHHPDIDIRWINVALILTTHDEGGITERDFSLARQFDELFSRSFAP